MNKLEIFLKAIDNHPKLFDKYSECLTNSLDNKKIINNIFAFKELPQGWNFGEGEPLRDDILLISLIVVELIPIDFLKNIEVFPLTDGGISFRIVLRQDLVIGLLISSEDDISSYIDNGTKIEDAGKLELTNIETHLKEIGLKINVEP